MIPHPQHWTDEYRLSPCDCTWEVPSGSPGMGPGWQGLGTPSEALHLDDIYWPTCLLQLRTGYSDSWDLKRVISVAPGPGQTWSFVRVTRPGVVHYMGLSFECGLGEQKKVVMAESAAQKWRGPRVSESRHVLNAVSEARTCP